MLIIINIACPVICETLHLHDDGLFQGCILTITKSLEFIHNQNKILFMWK